MYATYERTTAEEVDELPVVFDMNFKASLGFMSPK
jgi:hypothetical protein